jgi:hypothetical protein
VKDVAAQLTQKQQKQKQQEPIETHDLQESLAVIDRYLPRLGDIHPDWEWSGAALQPYYNDLHERKCKVRQTTN